MLIELTESDKDIAYSHAFVDRWLELSKAPSQVREHLGTIANGIKDLRERYYAVQEDLDTTNRRYTDLMALSAKYLQVIEKYKELADANPVEREQVPG
jgi:hypothetical protein